MSLAADSVCIDMAHTTHNTSVLALGLAAVLSIGTAQAKDPHTVTPHTRDASGIASAVTEVMPAIGDCLESDRALGGPAHLSVMIAFNVVESGEIGELVINGLQDRTHLTPLPSCLEGTLAAMRFAPGTQAIPVELPLEARATEEAHKN